MKRKFLIGIWAAVGAAALFGVVALYAANGTVNHDTSFVMGSVLEQTHWGAAPATKISKGIEALEQDLNAVVDPPELALEIMEASGGAFNPWLGALTKLWDVDGQGYVPTPEEIRQAMQKKELDLGAYGKGLACDLATQWLGYGTGSLVNLGGNILAYGSKPWNRPFKIALRDPKGGPNDTIGLFTLKGTHFISTSGSYEKYFERDGKRYHHIFDPATGYPAARDPGLISVTVITNQNAKANSPGALGDALSTASFVLGYEASQALLQKYQADAIFIYESGAVKYTGNVEDYFRLEKK